MKHRVIIASSLIGIALLVHQFGYFPFTYSETSGEPTIKPIASWVSNGVVRDGKEIDATKLLIVDSPKRLTTQPFALEAWFRYTDNKDYRWIVGSALPGVRWGVEVLRDHHRLAYVVNTQKGPLLINGATILRPGTWYAVLWQWNGTTLQTFINGKKDIEKDLSSAQVSEYPSKWYIGAGIWSKVQPLKGNVDEVLLFDRVFSADEIQKRYEDPQANKAATSKTSEVKQPDASAHSDTNKSSTTVTNSKNSAAIGTTTPDAESIFGKVQATPPTAAEVAAQPLSVGIHASRQEVVSGTPLTISWLISRKSPTPILCKIRETIGEKLVSEFDTPFAEGTRDFRPVINEEKTIYTYTYRCPSPIVEAKVNVTVNPGARPLLEIDTDRIDLGSVSQNSTPIAKDVKISSRCVSGQCSPLNWTAVAEAPFRLSRTSGNNEAFIKVSADTSAKGTFEKTATIRFHDQTKIVRLVMKVEGAKTAVSRFYISAPNSAQSFDVKRVFRLVATVDRSDGVTHKSDIAGQANFFRWQLAEGGAGLTINESTGEVTTTVDPDHKNDASRKYRIRVQYIGLQTPEEMLHEVEILYRPVISARLTVFGHSVPTETQRLLAGAQGVPAVDYELMAFERDIEITEIPIAIAVDGVVPTAAGRVVQSVSFLVSDTASGSFQPIGSGSYIPSEKGIVKIALDSSPLVIRNNQSKYLRIVMNIQTKEVLSSGSRVAVGIAGSSGDASVWAGAQGVKVPGVYGIIARDSLFQSAINPQINEAGSIQSSPEYSVYGGLLTVSRSSIQPSGLLGGDSMDLLKFDLKATGDTITIKDLEFVYTHNCSNNSAIGQVLLQSADRLVTYATWRSGIAWFGNASDSDANSIKVVGEENGTDRAAGGFDAVLTIGAGDTKHLVLSGDTSGCTTTNQRFQVSIDAGKGASRSNIFNTLVSGVRWQDTSMLSTGAWVDTATITKTLPVAGPLFQR